MATQFYISFHPDGVVADINDTGGDGFFLLPDGGSKLALRYRLASNAVIDLYPELTDEQVIQLSVIDTPPPPLATVTAHHFVKNLLGFALYGAMEVAEAGMAAKFAAGVATEFDIQALGLFRASKSWISMGQPITLSDPTVSALLDVCLAIPALGFTEADKVRILANIGIDD